ncbi:MAG: glycoside hydrolase family 88 protein [Tannerella sp.]|jgi:unsaturated rhamnogalacturonyl hydrolase|nr:glycoside hydrolase family 88 protein [Tannerella sp.]
MKKKFLLLALPLFISCMSTNTRSEGEKAWSQKMVESHGLGDFYCNRHYQAELGKTGWDYVSGLVANAVLKAWVMYPEKTEYYDAVKAFADNSTSEDGSMIFSLKGENALRPSNIDDLPAGRIYFELYKEEMKKGNTKDAERYKTASTIIRNKLKYDHSRIAEGLPGAGGFFHKAVYPNQMWLDGLYMGSTIYAEWQHAFGEPDTKDFTESWDDIATQFKTIHHYTYNEEKQLNYHAWSATPTDSNSFWANQNEPFLGCSKEFWGRGMGWYFAALADVLEYMPENHTEYDAVSTIFNQVAAGLKHRQDPASGVWYQLLQHDANTTADGKGDTTGNETYNIGTAPNYLEASCSSIFTYAYLKGIRLGLLDKTTYLPVAEKAYQGLLKTFIREQEGKTDIIQICASAGLGPARNPSRTGTINYYLCGDDVTIVENEGKAIGTFIMASLEYENHLRNKKD